MEIHLRNDETKETFHIGAVEESGEASLPEEIDTEKLLAFTQNLIKFIGKCERKRGTESIGVSDSNVGDYIAGEGYTSLDFLNIKG